MHTSQPARAAWAMCSAVSLMRLWTSSRISSSKVRIVPRSSTESGMMFSRTPPLIAPTVTTTGSRVMSTWRLTIVCRPSTTCAAVTIGSTPCHGIAPCVCRPATVIRKLSALAIAGPAR